MTDITNHVFGLSDVYDRVKRSVWPVGQDVYPDAFSFTDQTAVQPSATITSNTITVAGLGNGVSVPISITGGTYSKNGGGYVSTAGTVVNGDTVSLRHTSSASGTTAVNTVLTIGSLTDTFTSTTAAVDLVPDAFSFTTATGVTPSTLTTSNTITISGLTGAAAISITGGNYSINSGAYTASSGTISNGNTLTVQHTSSASYTTNVVTTVTIGGVNGTFTSTTRAIDNTPSAFSFTDVTSASPSTVYTSNTITVAGMDSGASAAVSISGASATYSKNGGAATSAAGTAVNGDTFAITFTSSSSFSTALNATLNIGGVTDIYTVTTRAASSTPTVGSFTALTNQVPESSYQSNTITVSGLDVSITGQRTGQFSIYQNGSQMPFGTDVTVNNGDQFYCAGTGGTGWGGAYSATLTLGSVTRTWSVTMASQPADAVCNAFTFTTTTTNVQATSNTVTISGMTAGAVVPVDVTYTGTSTPTLSKNGGSFSSSLDSTATNGDTFAIKMSPPGTTGQSNTATLLVGVTSTGRTSATWTVTRS